MSWTVDEVMTRQVVTVRPATPYKELVALMSRHAIGALPVVDLVDSDGRLVGMVSGTDLLAKERAAAGARRASRARAEQAKAHAETAGELMTSPVVTARAGDALARAARIMHRARVRHLPVVDATGRLVGILSRGDLLKPYLRSDESIRHEVATEVLGRLMDLPPDAVEVSVDEGLVTLRGELETSSAGDVAVRLASAVEGVVGVRNRLGYRLDASDPRMPPLPGARGLPAAEWGR
ncbi:MAG: CBS domain-containing protein [Chloroflexi bacterium]|nr:MAG: CBS domain-containing protein [Chloroflexota bacterium]